MALVVSLLSRRLPITAAIGALLFLVPIGNAAALDSPTTPTVQTTVQTPTAQVGVSASTSGASASATVHTPTAPVSVSAGTDSGSTSAGVQTSAGSAHADVSPSTPSVSVSGNTQTPAGPVSAGVSASKTDVTVDAKTPVASTNAELPRSDARVVVAPHTDVPAATTPPTGHRPDPAIGTGGAGAARSVAPQGDAPPAQETTTTPRWAPHQWPTASGGAPLRHPNARTAASTPFTSFLTTGPTNHASVVVGSGPAHDGATVGRATPRPADPAQAPPGDAGWTTAMPGPPGFGAGFTALAAVFLWAILRSRRRLRLIPEPQRQPLFLPVLERPG
jgi:hypothetical protein